MKTKWRCALELVQQQPGAFERRKQIILALCSAVNISHGTYGSEQTGLWIVEVANTVLEAELNLAPRPRTRK